MKTPLYRRVIYIAFIIIFLIVSPLIILYTMGYRYNFTKGRVQKTGILKITSVPRGATIKLNGQTYAKSQTPAKVEYLLPGDYEIALTKDGYHDWQKKLAVYDNGTTFAEKIMLWKKSEPQQLATSTASHWLVSPDQNLVAFSDQAGNVFFIDINSGLLGELSGGNIEKIGAIKNYGITDLNAFSPSGRYLLIKANKNKQQNYFLLDTISKEFKQLQGTNYQNIRWDKDNDDLYALNKTGLWQFNLSTLSPRLINKQTIIDDFFISNKTLYLINKQLLSQANLDGSGAKDLKRLTCAECRIQDIKNNRALIHDFNKGTLTIIDLSGQNKTVELPFTGLKWLNGNSMIIHNEFEVYIFETDKTEPELITRVSTPIESIIWHPKGRHLIFSSGNQLKIIELDNRELRNIIVLSEAAADHLVSDRAGQNIFYSLDKLGVFKLNIQ